jgi:hypothetical protein
MMEQVSCEQRARDLLERLGHPRAQQLSAGDVVELANLFNEIARLQARLDFVASYFEISEEDIDQAIDGIEDALIQTIEESGSEPQ